MRGNAHAANFGAHTDTDGQPATDQNTDAAVPRWRIVPIGATMRRIIVGAGSDFHGGSKFGLMNPDVILYAEDRDGNLSPWHPSPTAAQEYLWELYLSGIERTRALAGDDEIIMIHNGDECHGNTHPQSLVSTRIADQFLIAEANFRPFLALPKVKRARLVAGTGAHNFLEGSSTMIVAQLLAARLPKMDIRPVYHGLLDLDGFTVDYAHHGPHPGSRNWLEGNVARYYLRDLMWSEIRRGRKPPDLVLRGHFHQPVIETLRVDGYTSTLMILPSMCLIDDYTRQATRSASSVTNGITNFEIVDGKLLDIYQYNETLDIRTHEVLQSE